MLEELVYFIVEDMKYFQPAISVVLLLEQDKVLLLEDINLIHPLVEDMEGGMSLLNPVYLLLLEALGMELVLDQGNLKKIMKNTQCWLAFSILNIPIAKILLGFTKKIFFSFKLS